MKTIQTIREGERINEIFLCRAKTRALTKAGKPYESLLLQDKTGSIDAKIWDPGSQGIEDFDALDYVNVVADVTAFQGSLQLNVKRVRKCREGEYDPADYLPSTEKNTEEMYRELLELTASIKNKYLNQILKNVFDDGEFKKKFCFHSAAKSVHHGFAGGLLEHTLSVARNCEFFSKQYSILNRDLLVTAALFHDIGKLKELSTFPENDYTDEGQLIGHIVTGAQMVTDEIRRIPGFPKLLGEELIHCILAHHGELEFGSPKKPELAEAIALSFADNLDAKMETLKELFQAPGNAGGWFGFNSLMGSYIRKTDVEE
ncbi:MAG: HD domain-containing protein [Lachnospiraceae bacterium]|nr:HD domain-containing protein [Lachnospiraceae bacterium]